MRQKKFTIMIISTLVFFILTACSVISYVPKITAGQVETAVVNTAQAQLTQISVNTLVAQLTSIAVASPTIPPPTETPPPTAYPTFTNTSTAIPATATITTSPTNTVVIPTATPLPTNTQVITPVPCLSIKFIADVTIPDGTVLTPNQPFLKTWRVQNNGSCAWSQDFDILFISGNVMGAPGVQKLNTLVNPGQWVDISINMVAPSAEGTYKGDWKLRSPGGVIFGLGANGSVPFWAKIQVKSPVVITAGPGVALDFAANYCQASWVSSMGTLSCPSAANDFTNGSITYTNTPKLEGGYQDDEPSLILIPSNGSGGFISGRFPAITVQASDRFQALIGCLDSSPNCNVMLQLNYSASGGPIKNLGTWIEVSEGGHMRIDLPVGTLAGQSVQFILYANNNNGTSQDDRLFLLVPVIKR